MSVTVDSPKTPVTAGSHGVAAATVPNVCKMPGPPAPFVPTPLPNIGRSEDSPKGYSKNVRIEGKAVAIKGASFKSVGDIASKATGGGIVSANTHGPTQFVGPGAMDVKIEGKNVHLLGDPMLNNCAGGGKPANAATLLGVIQNCGPVIAVPEDVCPVCEKTHEAFQESEATTADAGALATNFKAAVKPAVQSGVSSPQTMLGVVHCKCGQKYADQSGLTTVELCEAAKGMKHPSGVTTSYKDGASRDAAKNDAEAAMVGRMRAHLKNSPAFRTRLAVAERKVSASLKDSSDGASYPPGACAAQKVLVLLLDDRAVPAAMTERWYGSETGSPIAYLEVSGAGRKRTRNRVIRKFKNGETVPPCGTCELLVPLLTCAQERPTCKHRT